MKRAGILFTLNLFIPHAFVIFILFVFHLLRLVQGKLYRYSPRLIENLPKAGINLGFSFFICRSFITVKSARFSYLSIIFLSVSIGILEIITFRSYIRFILFSY